MIVHFINKADPSIRIEARAARTSVFIHRINLWVPKSTLYPQSSWMEDERIMLADGCEVYRCDGSHVLHWTWEESQHRCCNKHGRVLSVADDSKLSAVQRRRSRELKKQHGRTYMQCGVGGCTVGHWSGSQSLPATRELRGLRAKVFEASKERGCDMFDLEMFSKDHANKIGCWNEKECETFLRHLKDPQISPEEVEKAWGMEIAGEVTARPVRRIRLD